MTTKKRTKKRKRKKKEEEEEEKEEHIHAHNTFERFSQIYMLYKTPDTYRNT